MFMKKRRKFIQEKAMFDTNPTSTWLRIRVPHELRNKLTELAEKNSRSLTAEVVARLEKSLEESHQIHEIGRMTQYHELRIEHIEDHNRRIEKQVDRLSELYNEHRHRIEKCERYNTSITGMMNNLLDERAESKGKLIAQAREKLGVGL